MVGVLISIWSVAHDRWSVVGGWSVGGGFVLRLCVCRSIDKNISV